MKKYILITVAAIGLMSLNGCDVRVNGGHGGHHHFGFFESSANAQDCFNTPVKYISRNPVCVKTIYIIPVCPAPVQTYYYPPTIYFPAFCFHWNFDLRIGGNSHRNFRH